MVSQPDSHAAADNLTERREGQTMLVSTQQPPAETALSERVSAMRAAPTSFDRPPDQRRRLIGLLDELSEQDRELLIDLAERLRTR